ncbi:MAG: N-acetylmuramoyl-L-alanine amidase [Silvanigrellales bacterium]|nr:N-acetylmuramoyl-L-alanine amidase [Silvanigrellales bacterium]
MRDARRRQFLKFSGSGVLLMFLQACKNTISGTAPSPAGAPSAQRVCAPGALPYKSVQPAVASSLPSSAAAVPALGLTESNTPFEKTFRYDQASDTFHLSLTVPSGDDTLLSSSRLSFRVGNSPWQAIPVRAKTSEADGNTFHSGRFQALLLSEYGKSDSLTFRIEADGVLGEVEAEVAAEQEEPLPLSLASEAATPYVPQGFSQAPVGITVISRAQWNALPPKKPADKATWKKIVCHHSAQYIGPNTDPGSVVRSYQRSHMHGEGWDDIGYNFLVAPDGRVFEGRNGGKNSQGAHTKSANDETVGINFMGQFHDPEPGSKNEPTAAQLDSGARLIAWLAKECGIDLSANTSLNAGSRAPLPNVAMHRDVAATFGPGDATACPGSRMYGKVGELRTTATSYLTQMENPAPQATPAARAPPASC